MSGAARVRVSPISPADYAKNVKRVERFLSGHRKDVVDELTSEMTDAAEALDFERAARVKRRLEVIRGLDDRQQVVFPSSVDIDVIGFYREETISAACVFVVREGRTVRTCEFILDKGLDVDEEELQSGFLSAITTRRLIFQLRSTFPSSLRMRKRWGSGLRASVSVPAISIGRSVAKSTVCSIWHPKMRAMPSCAT